MSRAWVSQPERSNPFTLKLICWIALHTGRAFARFWLYPITLYFYLTSPTVRRASRDYLSRVLSRPPGAWQVARHIFRFSATVLDRVYFLTDQFERFSIRIENQALLNAYQAEGQGVLLLGAHFGSFEVLRSLALDRYHVPLKILMYRQHNQMITRILEALNPAVPESVIDLGKDNALLQVHECLQRGEFVGVLADRVMDGTRVVQCPFLGQPATFPAGPMEMALMMNVPIILFYGIYEGGNRYTIRFEKLSDGRHVADRRQRRAVAADLMCDYVAALERQVRAHPYNWFNFYDFWAE